MHDVFSSVQSLLKTDSTMIDNNVFRLHYKATMFILIVFSVMISSKQYFGDPIDCYATEMDEAIMDSYCWIHGTFVLPEHYDNTIPGVGRASHEDTSEKVHHPYYQWVVLFLFCQAVMFYMPRYVWKTQEGEKMKKMVQDLDAPIVDEEKKDKKKATLTDFFKTNLHRHNYYAYKYFGCEILNFINIVGQMFFVNRFLGGEFTTYGTRVLSFTKEEGQINRADPMYLMFPRVTKCTLNTYGVSGSAETHDALCVLPLNVINEKIFIFMWFWFIIVAVITAFGIVYRALCFMPQFRNMVLTTRVRIKDGNALGQVTSICDIGDWFVLNQLYKNMDPIIFKEFISLLAENLVDLPANPTAPPRHHID